MSYQHTFYLKRNEADADSLSDEFDGKTYFWFAGCPRLFSIARTFGSVQKDGETVYFNSFQAMKMIAFVFKEIDDYSKILRKGYNEFLSSIIYEEQPKGSADLIAMDSYAILRSIHTEMRTVDSSILDDIESEFKLNIFVDALMKLISDMEEDDIFVWRFC